LKEKVYKFISGSKLAFFREKKGLRQEDLARMVGVSRPTVVTWEGKDKVKLSYDMVELIAVKLEVTTNDLTYRPDEKKEDQLDDPLVKSYVRELELLRKYAETLERENKRLRGE